MSETIKTIKFTDENLEKFFHDNGIEDDNLYDCLKGREGIIEMDDSTLIEGSKDDDEYAFVNVKIMVTPL